MSLEALEQLEQKVQMAIDTIALQQMEIDELKEKNRQLEQSTQDLKNGRVSLEEENAALRKEHDEWQEKIQSLLGKIDNAQVE